MSYLSYEEIVAGVRALADGYPERCRLVQLPNASAEGREVLALELGDECATARTAICVGGVHAREWIPPDALVYLCAGVAKVVRDKEWWAWSTEPPLATILADPLVGTLDPVLASRLAVPLYVLGVLTIGLECTGFLLLTRSRRAWGVVAAVMHVGIAFTLDIGAFSAGVLALYPMVLARERQEEGRQPGVDGGTEVGGSPG